MTGQGREAVDVLLAESFKELARKQPIEKITIKEITDKAGLIRPTFYNHFQDKYELLEWVITAQLLKPLEPLLQNGMVNEALLLLFTSIEREQEFYARACRMEGQNSFREHRKGMCQAGAATHPDGKFRRKSGGAYLADAGADRGVLCPVDVLYADPVGGVRDDDFCEGSALCLQLHDEAFDGRGFQGIL